MNKIIKSLSLFTLTLFSTLLIANSNPVYAASQLEGGDFAQAFNNTTQVGTWRDPITADPSDVVEFRVVAKNIGDQPTGDVQIWGSVNGLVPQNPAMSLVMTSRVNDPNMSNVIEDSVTTNINGSTPVGMRYYPGHARINGRSSTFNCVNSCDIGDSGVLGGMSVGVIQPGDFIELTFKASLSALATPTPAPTVAPTPAPTPAPTVAPTTPPIGGSTNNNCTGANSCSGTGGSVTVVVPTTPPAAAPKTLPKTGLPTEALLGLGSLPIGVLLRKFRKGNPVENDPSYIWDDRQFKLD